MKRIAWLAIVLFLVSGVDQVHGDESPPPTIVYLDQARNWQVFSHARNTVSPLARELVRQAFLIAARDELGLATRDAWLGDAMPAGRDNALWDVATTLRDDAVAVEMVRGEAPNQARSGQQTLGRPIRAVHSMDYRLLTEAEEVLSRTTFVDALKQAGFKGQPNRPDESIAVPPPIDKLLGEMNFLSQFRAVRELHRILRRQGESAAVLGALSRGYANLGVLTEFYWHPAHKVFKARAMLYAQRMLARDKASPVAKWHRAYAAALAGVHTWAMLDFKEAEEAWQAIAEADRPPKPVWTPLVAAICSYDIGAFAPLAKNAKTKELAALSRFLTVEQAGSQIWAVQTAIETLKVVPECYRVHDSLCEFAGVQTLHTATFKPIQILGDRLYARLDAMPGLPDAVRDVVAEQKKTKGGLLANLIGGRQTDFADEFRARRQITDALFKTGEAVANDAAAKPESADSAESAGDSSVSADSVEPSWAALGLLLRELSFMQVYRRASFERHAWGVRTEPWLEATAPLVDGHPFQPYLETYAWENERQQTAYEQLAKAEVAGIEVTAHSLFQAYSSGEHPMAKKFFFQCWRNADYVAHDYVVLDRNFVHDQGETKWVNENLLAISPRSPLARALLVERCWDDVKDKVEEWDKMSSPYPSLSFELGSRYLTLGRSDDAERCFKAAIRVAPSDQAYHWQLAEVYKRRGDMDRWLSTLKEYLKQPDYGLSHASVQRYIAEHYMETKDWEAALPFAESAAECYSAWGLLCAAKCREAMQQWKEAETHYRNCSERYSGSSLEWFFFCRRTGEGDIEAARQLAEQYVVSLSKVTEGLNAFDLITFHLLNENLKDASSLLEKITTDNPNLYNLLWMAEIADRLDDAKRRDATLERAKTTAIKARDSNPKKDTQKEDTEQKADGGGKEDAVKPGDDALDPALDPAGRLAIAMMKDLEQGGKGDFFVEAADKIAPAVDPGDMISYQYSAAQYCLVHGRPQDAIRYFKLCMGSPRINVPYRTLAGAALLEQDIWPADYQPPMEKEPANDEKPMDQNEKSEDTSSTEDAEDK